MTCRKICAGLQAEIDYYSAVLESVQRTDQLLRAADPDPRALVVNAYRATELIYNAPVRATWDQIVSSGHLGLLPAGAADSGLSQYYAFDTAQDVYRAGLNSAYRQTVRQIIPITTQVAMRAGCSDVRNERGNIVGFAKNCDLQVDPAALRETAVALRSNPAVLADLQYQYSFAVSATLNLGGGREESRSSAGRARRRTRHRGENGALIHEVSGFGRGLASVPGVLRKGGLASIT